VAGVHPVLDADPKIPMVNEARAEYAHLQWTRVAGSVVRRPCKQSGWLLACRQCV